MCASCAWIVFSCLMRVSSDLMMPSCCVIVLVFGFGFGFRTSARIVAVTLLGIAEKNVKCLFRRDPIVLWEVEAPFSRPCACGVFCHKINCPNLPVRPSPRDRPCPTRHRAIDPHTHHRVAAPARRQARQQTCRA